MTSLARFLLSLLCTLTLAGTAHADRQEELDNLRKRIAAMQRELEDTSESKAEAADALRESERAISTGKRRLAELAVQQREADQRLGELEQRQQVLGGKLAAQQGRLERLLYRRYLDGQQAHLRLLLGNRDPEQTARNLRYYQYIAREQGAWLAVMRNDLAALDEARQATRRQRAELEAMRAEEAAQARKLEQEQRSRQQTLKKISLQLRQQRREINRLQRDENRLAQLVDKLTRMLAQPQSGALFRNDRLPDARFDGSPFDQLKGKLTLPVKGEVTNRFGAPRPDSTISWKGLFLRTSGGQAVKAIAAGRVVFADWLRGFGNLLIVDHGKGYMSLYGNNETLYKQVGDVLRGGDTIAATGNSGGNEESGLYFELRHQSKPLDPVRWLATK